MDWLQKMNGALASIENQLTDDVDYAKIAAKAACSPHQFQRMFSFIAGVSLSDYIRFRRLSQAALELQNGPIKVIDLALKYGYESPTAFARAFQNMHGLSPTQARVTGAVLKAYPPISFNITIKGATPMDYRIEHKAAFRVIGTRHETTLEGNAHLQTIPQFWQEAQDGNAYATLREIQKQQMDSEERPMGMMGICSCNHDPDCNEINYFIAVQSDEQPKKGFESILIPATTWAIFECKGPVPEAIQNRSKQIYTEWLPSSGYQFAQAPDIEIYFEGDPTASDYRSEIWIPIMPNPS